MTRALSLFEWCAGSTPGRDHLRALKNGHDAYHAVYGSEIFAGVVCDGCGSGAHSEVGAKIAARLVVEEMLRQYSASPYWFETDVEVGLRRVRRGVLSKIQMLADQMGGSFSQVVVDYFLFTILGALVTPKTTIVFGAGDGIFWLNGARCEIDSPGNKPAYLSYGMSMGDVSPLNAYRVLPTEELKDLILGTDGAVALEAAAAKRIPGKDKPIGPIRQFVEQDRYFKNPFALGHYLKLVNRTSQAIDYENKRIHEEHGPLSDDTTLLVVRRKA